LQPHHPNIQLAAIVIDQAWAEVASFEQKIWFNEADADPEALKINHYSREAWKDAIKESAAVQAFSEWVEPYRSIQMMSTRSTPPKPYYVGALAGHNVANFDLARLRAMYGSTFFPFSYHTKDTLQRALWYFDENPELVRPASLKLSVLAEYFGISSDGAHDALADVRLSAGVARAIRKAEGKL